MWARLWFELAVGAINTRNGDLVTWDAGCLQPWSGVMDFQEFGFNGYQLVWSCKWWRRGPGGELEPQPMVVTSSHHPQVFGGSDDTVGFIRSLRVPKTKIYFRSFFFEIQMFSLLVEELTMDTTCSWNSYYHFLQSPPSAMIAKSQWSPLFKNRSWHWRLQGFEMPKNITRRHLSRQNCRFGSHERPKDWINPTITCSFFVNII